jgi:hypothetical protein
MWLSTRFKFREGDEHWSSYLAFVGLPQLKEVRSLDAALSRCVDDRECPVASLAELPTVLEMLPPVANEGQYHLLVVDAEEEKLPTGRADCRLLGYDLSDETHTSSLLNCGPWKGKLAPVAGRLNLYGLLTHEDALLAQALLPEEWPGDPHGEVTIWALYEVAADRT